MDDEAETDTARQTMCGACVEAGRDAAWHALQAAIAADHPPEIWERAQLAA